MSNSDSRISSYARKDVFFLVRVLVKVRFPDSKATDPTEPTVSVEPIVICHIFYEIFFCSF
jgi:hypothetical protein